MRLRIAFVNALSKPGGDNSVSFSTAESNELGCEPPEEESGQRQQREEEIQQREEEEEEEVKDETPEEHEEQAGLRTRKRGRGALVEVFLRQLLSCFRSCN